MAAHSMLKLKNSMHESRLFGNTSEDDGAIRLSAASLETGPATCTELAMHGVIQTTIDAEPVEAPIHSYDSTHAGSELGEAQSDDYLTYSTSELA